jgi:glycosyltransferase involved in cell wall biosynthesis
MFFSSTSKSYVIISHGLEERAVDIGRKNGYVKSGFLRMAIWKVKNYLLKRAFAHACHILVCNDTDKDYLIKRHHIRCNQVSVLQHGFYDYTKTPIEIKDEVTILFNGAWTERKGVTIVKQFIQYALTNYENVRFIILTSGINEDQFRGNFSEIHLARIQLRLNYGFKEELEYLSQAQIFLLTSYFEGQPLSLLQAMACGLCPVVSDNSGQIDLVRNGVNGCVFETGSIEALCHAFDTLMLNRSEITRMANKAKASVQGRSWNNVSDKLVAQLINCLN